MKILHKPNLMPITCDCCECTLLLKHRDLHYYPPLFSSDKPKFYTTCRVCGYRINLYDKDLFRG